MMQHEQIEQSLTQLQLRGMLDACQANKPQQSMTNQQWEAWLLGLLEAEIAHRQTRSYAYRLTLARLPQMKTLEHFVTQQTPIAPEKLEQLQTCQFISNHENVLLMGGSGTGKTHIALALAHKALQHDFRITFYRFNDLARRLISAREHRLESRLMEKLMRFHLLVIDELGYVPIDKNAGALLFELFSGLYEKGSLMITTHLAFDEWQDIFGHKKSTKTLIDRITHHCHLLETGNESWRLMEGKLTKK